MTLLGKRGNRISDRSRKPNGKNAVRIVATNRQYGDLCRGSLRRLPSISRSKVDLLTFPSWNDVVIPRAPRWTAPTIFISRLADVVPEVAKKAREAGRAKHLLFSEGMPIEALASRLPRLDVRDANRVHVAREGDAESIAAILYRLFRAIARPKETHSILDAWVEGEDIVLLSPAYARLSVPLGKLTRFIGDSQKAIKAFEIDEDGRFLFWPHADVHLGWEQMRQFMDPTAAVAGKQKTEKFNRSYGSAVRRLREQRGLNQAAINGLSERHVRRIEQGKQAVTSSSLRALAKAHDMPVEDYLKELASRLP